MPRPGKMDVDAYEYNLATIIRLQVRDFFAKLLR
jgi:hypothetical protein